MATIRSERPRKDIDYSKIVELWRKGVTCDAIRERLGCSQSTIAAALAEWRNGKNN